MNFLIRESEKKAFALLFATALLFIYPLMHYGIYFRDDLHRSVTGYYGWSGLGRPLADIVIKVASASGDRLLDIFPYNLILSCAMLSLACIHIARLLQHLNIKKPTFCASLFIFNPFFLQNLAYRFDSTGMSLALLLCALSYTYQNNNIYISLVIKILLGVATLSLYQPCANLFIGLLSIELSALFITNNTNNKKLFLTLIKKAGVFLSFYSIYFLIVARIWGSENNRSEIVKLNTDGLNHIYNTFQRLNTLLESFFNGPVIFYFIPPVILLFIFIILTVYKNRNNSLATKMLLLLLSLSSAYISLLGPTFILVDAPVFPRTLVSFSILFVLFSMYIISLCDKLKCIALIPVVTVIAFSSQFANALNTQREHENFVLNMVAYDLMNINGIQKIKTVGKIRFSKRAELLTNDKPLISQSISRATEFLATYQIVNKGLKGVSDGYGIEKSNKEELDSFKSNGVKPYVDNNEYSIYENNGVAIVVFKG